MLGPDMMPEGVGGVSVGSWASSLSESEAPRQPWHESDQKLGREAGSLLQRCRIMVARHPPSMLT